MGKETASQESANTPAKASVPKQRSAFWWIGVFAAGILLGELIAFAGKQAVVWLGVKAVVENAVVENARERVDTAREKAREERAEMRKEREKRNKERQKELAGSEVVPQADPHEAGTGMEQQSGDRQEKITTGKGAAQNGTEEREARQQGNNGGADNLQRERQKLIEQMQVRQQQQRTETAAAQSQPLVEAQPDPVTQPQGQAQTQAQAQSSAQAWQACQYWQQQMMVNHSPQIRVNRDAACAPFTRR